MRLSRMRQYRRNFKHMYPKAGEEAKAAAQLQIANYLRWRIWARAAVTFAALSAAAAACWWVLR